MRKIVKWVATITFVIGLIMFVLCMLTQQEKPYTVSSAGLAFFGFILLLILIATSKNTIVKTNPNKRAGW